MTDFKFETPVFLTWLAFRSVLPSHLKPFLEKLSQTHPSGIHVAHLDSPMMRQFKQAKDETPDALLFFRMGDFFELFGLDAIIVSDICDLTLTSRDKSHPNPIPMAGVPVVSYKNALKKCLDAGFKVAVCDQVEDPRFAKGIVRREITRIATPAVPGDLENEDTGQKNIFGCYLASVVCVDAENTFAFSYVDVSTGEFRLTANLSSEALQQEILTIKPKEILCDGRSEKKISMLVQSGQIQSQNHNRTLLNRIEPWLLKSETLCKDVFREFFDENDFHAFGLSTISGALPCVTAILYYLKTTQKNILKNIRNILYYVAGDHLLLDDSTKRNLDLFYTSTGDKKGSLLSFLNQCYTAMGGRALFRRMNYPFKCKQAVEAAHNDVDEFYQQNILCIEIQNYLSKCCDIEKILSRVSQKSLDVKSVVVLKNALSILPNFLIFIHKYKTLLPRLHAFAQKHNLETLSPLIEFLNSAVSDNISNQIGVGPCVFLKGHSKELDEICDLEQNFHKKLEELEIFERTRSQIPTLRIGYTRVFGYYFEISRGKLAQVPKHFERKQTLTNAERFITPELKQLEAKALSAGEQRLVLERELFEVLRLKILEFSKELLTTARFLADVDLNLNFAQIARKYSWVKPVMWDAPEMQLLESYHPVMKHLSSTDEEFIANTVEFNSPLHSENDLPTNTAENRIHLITGPNMSGKSTLMRQVAVNQLLCQMGSFVCAKSARIGVADRILSRIGSGDHALKNQSTFMVEMLETAHILRLATSSSLLLLDEVGRGTSTYDGLSLAWAILEEIHDTCCPRTLFSTHYHELVNVCRGRPGIVPMQMGVLVQTVKNAQGQEEERLVFSRKYAPGSIGQSFGLNVALLAGVPARVVERAQEILKKLEDGKTDSATEHKAKLNEMKGVFGTSKRPKNIKNLPERPTLF